MRLVREVTSVTLQLMLRYFGACAKRISTGTLGKVAEVVVCREHCKCLEKQSDHRQENDFLSPSVT